MLDQLEAIGSAQQPRPLQDPLLWGNYNVAYTSIKRTTDKGQRKMGLVRVPLRFGMHMVWRLSRVLLIAAVLQCTTLGAGSAGRGFGGMQHTQRVLLLPACAQAGRGRPQTRTHNPSVSVHVPGIWQALLRQPSMP